MLLYRRFSAASSLELLLYQWLLLAAPSLPLIIRRHFYVNLSLPLLIYRRCSTTASLSLLLCR